MLSTFRFESWFPWNDTGTKRFPVLFNKQALV